MFGPRHWGKGPKKRQEPDIVFDMDDEDDEDYSERLSVWDAADIWLSSGKDEDYMFGYTVEELEEASR